MTTDRWIPSFDGCGLRVRAEGRPDRPAVLLSHSLGATLQIWDDTAAALAEHYYVIRFDSRGHGRSHAPGGPYNITMLGRDALAILDALEVPKTHYVGLSQGAMTGMWLASQAGARIDHLVLANTTAFIAAKDPLNALIERAAKDGMDSIAGPTILGWLSPVFKFAHPEKTAELVETMRAMSPIGYAGACAILRDIDLRADLAHIKVPTLIVSGIEDGERGATAAALLTRGIQGARRVDLANAAHLSPVENPVQFNQAVLEFLA